MRCEHWFKFDGVCKHYGYRQPLPDLGLVPLHTKTPQANRAGVVKQIIPAMRAALVAIQELHPIEETGVEYHGVKEVWCPTCRDHAPCPTRRLADQGLGGGQDE